MSSGGALQIQINLKGEATGAAVIDDRGRLLVATTDGLQQWLYDGRFAGSLGTDSVSVPPLLTERGLIAWGADDWRVHVWTGGVWAPFAWAQPGGGSRRAWSTTRPATLVARAQNWADEPQFGYFLQLASSGDDAKQQTVLRLFEEKDAQGALLSTWPFANVILTKILRSGLTELELHNNYVTNNWPANRLRAYRLMARTAGTEDREELLSLIDREFDPVNLALGARALAGTGWDGDGRLMKMLASLQVRKPSEGVLADALLDAAWHLWLTGGNNSDPSMVPMLTAIYQANLPRSVRLKAQKFFQDIMDSP
jgi:hypothetical protein